MRYALTPRGFLVTGGAALLLLGLVGFLRVLTESASPSFWLDDAENVAHVGLGAVALAAVYVPGLNRVLAPYYRWIVGLIGLIGLFFAVYGQSLASGSPNTFGIADLEGPLDNVLHLVVGLWAVWVAYRPTQPAA